MGGRKRKIEIKWIEDKNRRAVTFSKRRKGIFSKAAELCELSGAQIAILVSPVSSQSHKSFYSFGHSSVDSVISAFLNNERPREEASKKFWWEDESLLQSEDPNELRCAVNSVSSILHRVKALRAKKLLEKQTVDIPSTSSASLCVEDDYLGLDHVQGNLETEEVVVVPENENQASSDYNKDGLLVDLETLGLEYLEGNNSEGQELIVSSSDNINNNNNDDDDLDWCQQEFSLDVALDFVTETQGTLMNMDMATMNHNPYSAFEQDGTLMMVHTDSDDGQLVSNSDNNNNINLNGCNQELDFDQFHSLEDVSMATNMCSDFVDTHRDLDQDNLRFSDYFNDQEVDLDQINSEDAQVVTHRDLDQESLLFSDDFFNDLTPIVAL